MPRRLFWSLTSITLVLSVAMIGVFTPSSASAQTLTPGTTATVSGDGDCLRMRAGATISAAIITCLDDGSTVTIREGTQSADGYDWVYVEGSAGELGWVAAEFLEPTENSTPTATPSGTASPTATPTPGSTVTPPATDVQLGSISGVMPPGGELGLVVWGGGSLESLIATASDEGCGLRSVFTTRGGVFVGYTVGAPTFVNANWSSQIGDSLPETSALIVICGGAQPDSGAPTGGEQTATNAPADNGQPPGPGGNQ